MILKYKYKKARASFGLGKTSATISIGDTIKIWQSTIYNSNYDLSVNYNSGYTSTISNKNEIDITGNIAGNYKIEITVMLARVKITTTTLILTVV